MFLATWLSVRLRTERREMGLFRSAGLFRSYANFITAIAQRTKIIKLNHLHLYDIQTDHI